MYQRRGAEMPVELSPEEEKTKRQRERALEEAIDKVRGCLKV